jgi:hypothetical protein
MIALRLLTCQDWAFPGVIGTSRSEYGNTLFAHVDEHPVLSAYFRRAGFTLHLLAIFPVAESPMTQEGHPSHISLRTHEIFCNATISANSSPRKSP